MIVCYQVDNTSNVTCTTVITTNHIQIQSVLFLHSNFILTNLNNLPWSWSRYKHPDNFWIPCDKPQHLDFVGGLRACGSWKGLICIQSYATGCVLQEYMQTSRKLFRPLRGNVFNSIQGNQHYGSTTPKRTMCWMFFISFCQLVAPNNLEPDTFHK